MKRVLNLKSANGKQIKVKINEQKKPYALYYERNNELPDVYMPVCITWSGRNEDDVMHAIKIKIFGKFGVYYNLKPICELVENNYRIKYDWNDNNSICMAHWKYERGFDEDTKYLYSTKNLSNNDKVRFLKMIGLWEKVRKDIKERFAV